jgi:hypothetical protein
MINITCHNKEARTGPCADVGDSNVVAYISFFDTINNTERKLYQPVYGDFKTSTAYLFDLSGNSITLTYADSNKTRTELEDLLVDCCGCVGGDGTVTSFSAGNLSPLFTTGVATPTTTPALSFNLSNCNQYQVFGRVAAGTGAPSYVPLNPIAFNGLSLPNNQIAYGTGSGISSSSYLTYTGDAINHGDGLGTKLIQISSGGAVNEGGYILFKRGGSNTFFFGDDAAGLGGSSNDALAFVYGNNKYHIATNGVRRLTVGGNGYVTINNIPSSPSSTDILVSNSGVVSTRTVASLGIPVITPAALTKTNDTNVTISLGGTPATALLQGVSLTMGWAGVLAITRGGTGLGSLGTANQLLRVNTGETALEYFTPTWTTNTGTVTSFSAGNLSPLFTTNVATPTTTPALSFNLSNCNQYQVFGRVVAGTGAPSYVSLNPIAFNGLAIPSGQLVYGTGTSVTSLNKYRVVAGEGIVSGDGIGVAYFGMYAGNGVNEGGALRIKRGSNFVTYIGSDCAVFGGNNDNTTIFAYGNNSVNIATNGVRRLTVGGNGYVTINNIPTAASATDILVSNGGVVSTRTVASLGIGGGSAVWKVQGGSTDATTNTQNIYHNANVWLGDGSGSSSSYRLHVSGISYFTGTMTLNNITSIKAWNNAASQQLKIAQLDSSNIFNYAENYLKIVGQGEQAGNITISAYPHTRRDTISDYPRNVLVTNSSGNLLSLPGECYKNDNVSTSLLSGESHSADSTWRTVTWDTVNTPSWSQYGVVTTSGNMKMKLPTSTYEYGTHLIFVTINYTGGTSSEVNAEIRINGSTVIGSATTNATASKNTLTFFAVVNNNPTYQGSVISLHIRVATGTGSITVTSGSKMVMIAAGAPLPA